MNLIFNLLVYACLSATFILISVIAHSFWKKTKVETCFMVQASSGDSENMEFRHNFMQGESEESKASKIHESFQFIQDRKDENHAKWLAIKAKAIEENSKLTPEQLKEKISRETQLIQ